MKNRILFLAIAFTVLYSCSYDDGLREGEFSYIQDGEEIKAASAENLHYSQNTATEKYVIYAKINDSVAVYIHIPDLEITNYNFADDSTNASMVIISGKTYYYSYYGSEADYSINIDSYDEGAGILEGTFSGMLGSRDAYNGSDDYIEITEGEFSIED